MIRVLIMGSDVQTEVALMRRLQRIAALPAEGLAMGYDLDGCDLLVVHDTPVLRATAARLRSARPERPLWLIDAGGRLFDPPQGNAPLNEAAIRQRLHALHAPQAEHARSAGHGEAVQPFADQVRQRLAAGTGQAVLSLDGVDVLQLDFASGTATAPRAGQALDHVPGLLGPGFERLALRLLDIEAPAAKDGPRLPLTPLLWQIALRMRMVPKLIDPLTETTALRMAQWPDFRVLAHRHDDFRLCTLLLKQACTAVGAAELLDIEPGAARAFFNAAYLSGHATPEAAPAEAGVPVAAPTPSGSRLAQLWRGMRGGGRRRGDA